MFIEQFPDKKKYEVDPSILIPLSQPFVPVLLNDGRKGKKEANSFRLHSPLSSSRNMLETEEYFFHGRNHIRGS